MNKERRKKIKNIIHELEFISSELTSVKDDEEFAFDSMPEGLQSSMRGEESEEAIEFMDKAIEQIDQALENLEDII